MTPPPTVQNHTEEAQVVAGLSAGEVGVGADTVLFSVASEQKNNGLYWRELTTHCDSAS